MIRLLQKLALLLPALFLFPSSGQTADPVLARLYFKVPPDRMAEFEAVYHTKIAPFLKKYGLVASSRTGRLTPENIFSQLFELKSAAEIDAKKQALTQDTAWRRLGRELRQTHGAIFRNFGPYIVPAGPGKTVLAGPGTQISMGSGKGIWQTFDETDGLADGPVGTIFQDRDGYLWVGTSGGASRYDGHTWTTFTQKDGLGHDWVRGIGQDDVGNMWFGTSNGISRFNGKTWKTFNEADGLPSQYLWEVMKDRKDNMWFGMNGGISRYDGHRFTHWGLDAGINSRILGILQDRNGDMWFVAQKQGIIHYDGETWNFLTSKDSFPDGNYDGSILEDREGALWFTPYGKGLIKYDGKTLTTFTTQDGLANNNIRSIYQDQNDNLWFGTRTGLTRYDGHTWTTFTSEQGLATTEVLASFQDREGNLWFGSNPGGLAQYGGTVLTTYTVEDGLPDNRIRTIFKDSKDVLWFGTYGSLIRFDGYVWTVFTGLSDRAITRIFEDQDKNLWFNAHGLGVIRYNGRTFTTFTTRDGLGSAWISGIFQDQDGNLWFTTWGEHKGGVTRYDGKTFTTFTEADGLPSNWINSALQDKQGNFWFGCNSGGVCRYDGNTWATFTEQDGLAHNHAQSIFQDQEGTLWFGSNQGILTRYDGKTFTPFPIKGGTMGKWILSIDQDQQDHLWFSTSGGVGRYDGTTLQTLDQVDGLGHNTVNGVRKDRNGNFWFATLKGITRFRPPPPVHPPVFIDAIETDRRYENVTELAIPTTTGLTVFEVRAISFKTRPDAMIYRYRLKGHDTTWHVTRNNRIEYQDIPWGDYTFEVFAVDRDLGYSKTSATVELTVHLPYERIALLSALAIALLLIAWQATRILQRNRQLQSANTALSDANKELFQTNQNLEDANQEIQLQTKRKSAFLASMSHELRTPMNAILGFTRLVLRRSGNALPDQQKDNLNKVTDSANYLLEMINDLLDLSKIEAGRMDVDVKTFRVETLVALCCDTVSPLVKPGVVLNYEVDDTIGKAKTDEGKLRQILINLLSNALKFTEEGEVRIDVSQSDGRISIAVSDTGTGIPEAALRTIFEEFQQVKGSEAQQKGTGLGLAITKRFAELLGGSIGVESKVGEGSTFTVSIPAIYRKNER